MKTLAGKLATSALFDPARRWLECNRRDWNYPLTRWQKLQVGCYMILRDYGDGIFPPRFDDEQAAFAAERNYEKTLQSLGKTEEELRLGFVRKPFWHPAECDRYLRNYGQTALSMHQCGLKPPDKLLELGCGDGWMAEFSAVSGYRVTATSLDPRVGDLVARRRCSLEVKGIPADLEFRATPMEYVNDAVSDLVPFDAVYVYEALHHAHSWRKSIRAAHACLAGGGWFFILNEPNRLHTLVSYRVGRLSGTHEIGLSRGAIVRELRRAGFGRIRILKHRLHWWIKPIWLAARK